MGFEKKHGFLSQTPLHPPTSTAQSTSWLLQPGSYTHDPTSIAGQHTSARKIRARLSNRGLPCSFINLSVTEINLSWIAPAWRMNLPIVGPAALIPPFPAHPTTEA